jgi:hypothetical protein
MKRFITLVNIEWFKFNRTGKYIWFGIFWLILSSLSYLTAMSTVLINDPIEKQRDLSQNFFSVSFGLADIFIVVMVIILTAREYTNQVTRKKLINGYRREEIFESHVIFLTLISFLVTALILLSWLTFSGFIQQWPINKGMASEAASWLMLWPYLFSHGLLALFIIVLVRKTGTAILLYIAIRVTEGILSLFNQYMKQKEDWPIISDDVLPGQLFKQMATDPGIFTQWQAFVSYASISLFLVVIIYLKVKKSDY